MISNFELANTLPDIKDNKISDNGNARIGNTVCFFIVSFKPDSNIISKIEPLPNNLFGKIYRCKNTLATRHLRATKMSFIFNIFLMFLLSGL